MINKLLSGIAVLGLVIAMGGASARAQDMSKLTLFGGYSYESVSSNLASNFFVGGPLGSLCLFSSCAVGIHGYSISGTWNFNDHLGIEANFAGHNGSTVPLTEATPTAGTIDQDTDLYTYTFGPNVRQSIGNFEVFTHFLVGAMHAHQSNTETGGFCDGEPCITTQGRGSGFAFVTGGGADWNHGRWGVRILEVDYVHGDVNATTTTSTSTSVVTIPASTNDVRLSTGLTFHWGMR